MFRLTVFTTAALALALAAQESQASGLARGPSGPLRTAYTHVHIVIDGQTARTEVDQVFVNDLPGPVEASFAFPLPGDATVTGFADYRGGKRVEAGIASREAADKAYDTALAEGKRVAKGEVEPERFRMHLDAVPAKGSRRVSLSYVQSLDALGGARNFVFPAEREGHPSVFDLDVDLRTGEAGRSLTSVTAANHTDARISGKGETRIVRLNRTARGLERDFVLRWQQPSAPLDLAVRAARSKTGDTAYLEARFAFDADPFEGDREGRDVVLLLDASLSMAGEPLKRGRALARDAVAALGPQDRVALLILRDDVEAWVPAFVSARSSQITEAIAGLETLRAGGRTDISAGLQAAGELLQTSPDGLLLVATDGQPTQDTLDESDPFGIDVDASLYGTARVVIAQLVWPRRAAELVQLFPQATARYLPDGPAGDPAAAEVVRLVTAPVLEDVSVTVEPMGDDSSVRDVEGALPGRLSRGEAIRIMARVSGSVRVRVEGNLHGAPVALESVVTPAAAASNQGELLGVEWARMRVSGLEASLARADEPTREVVGQEIRGLGLTYGIATRMTSFVTAPTEDTLGPDRIKPGDPEIRVHAPRNALQVIGVLPWGEVIACVFDKGEDLWLGRFLVPRGFADGLYKVRILVKSQSGWKARGTLHFRVDSAPPTFELSLETADGLPLDAKSIEFAPERSDFVWDSGPLRLVARPADHVFDDDGRPTDDGEGIVRDRLDLKRISVRIGDLEIPLERAGDGERWEGYLPADLPPGRHTARMVAIDYALNSTENTLEIEVP